MLDQGNRCTICVQSGPLESHHTIPRSRGGEHSLQIMLCSNCHRNLHFNALAIVSQINNPRKNRNNKRYWRNEVEELRAEPFLKILVTALVRPIPEELEREHLLSINVSSTLFEQFKLLQLDTGLSSQEKVLNYCIRQALIIRGIENVYQQNNTSASKKDSGSDLQFMFWS